MAPSLKTVGKATKVIGRVQAKAKGRGKDLKPSAKRKGQAKANPSTGKKAASKISGKDERQVVPMREAKAKNAGNFRKHVLEEIGEKNIQDAIDEQQKKKQRAETDIARANELNASREALVNDAKIEYENARAEVQVAIAKEGAAAEAYRAAKFRNEASGGRMSKARNELALSQKKYAMLEVIAINHRKMKEFQKARQAATDAAAEAKRQLQAQKQKEKEAIEATKREISEQRVKLKEGQLRARRVLDAKNATASVEAQDIE